MAFNLKPIRYTFLGDHELGLQTVWQWAKKLINDLNMRDQTLVDAFNNHEHPTTEDGGDTTTSSSSEDLIAVMTLLVTDPNALTDIVTGNGQGAIPVDATLNGWEIIDVSARLTAECTNSDVIIQLRRERLNDDNVYESQDLLSTLITIQEDERSSTSATGYLPVVDSSVSAVLTDDQLWVDVDQIGIGARGLSVTVAFREVADVA